MANDKRLYTKAVAKIQEFIASGEYRAGSRLPPERELAEQFGVSRPTIREAIIALEAKGLVSVKTGSGVYVLEQKEDHGVLGSMFSAFEVIEARVFVEGEAAALAAEIISKEELEQIKLSVDLMANDPSSAAEGFTALFRKPLKIGPYPQLSSNFGMHKKTLSISDKHTMPFV